MTDILNFPGRATGSRQEFLQEEDETLQFDSDCSVAGFTMPTSKETTLSAYRAPKNQYWSNQELASLFRVKRLLDAAGIVCEVDHDCTDEGDPWFVFCDAAGEVFIHLCRIDGKYLLDSPNISSPLTGWDFSELIEGFIQRNVPQEDHPAASTATGSGQRVVRFERNGKVFMHPATMLAALIWTLFLDSEDLVMLLPESTDAQTRAVDDLARQSLSAEGDQPSVSAEQGATRPDETNVGQHKASIESTPMSQFLRDMSSHNDAKLGYNTYAVGLSAIAISAGFMSESSSWDITLMDLSSIITALLDNEPSDVSDGGDMALTDLDENAFDFLAFAQTIMGNFIGAANATEIAANAQDASNEQLLTDSQMFQTYLATMASEVSQDAMSLIMSGPQKVALHEGTPTETADTPLTDLEGTLQGYVDALPSDDGSSPQSLLARFSLGADTTTFMRDDLRAMTVQNTDIRATFAVTENIFNKANTLLAKADNGLDLPFPEDDKIGFSEAPKIGRQAYDERAEQILQFIMDQSQDMEIIATQDEVMFFDSAIMGADVDDIMVFSWSLGNGDIIAAMGLRSQLESVDLIS